MTQGGWGILTLVLPAPERRAEHGAVALYVQPKSAVVILMVLQVAQHLLLVLGAEHGVQLAHGVEGDDEARHKKHGSAIVSREMTVVGLEALVK